MLGPLIIVSGPSGGGKTTVIGEVLKICPKPIRVAVTATTRSPRPGEVDGINYHFRSKEKFLEEIAAGSFIEYAVVHNRDYYGTPIEEVEPYRRRGIGVILIIDVQGAAQVRRIHPDVFSVFLHAPDDYLRARLQKRGERAESIERRLESARSELARVGEYSVEILNDQLDDTVREMGRLIVERFH